MKTVLAILLFALGGCANAQPPFRDAALTLHLAQGTCSGTAVGPHILLTASHCLEDGNRIVGINGQAAYGLKVIHDGADHALVRVNLTFKTWAKVDTHRPLMADRVRLIGNPAANENVYREGYVARSYSDEVWLDLHGFPGDSGAGVFCADGRICGVVSAGKIWTRGQFSFTMTVLYPVKFTPADWKAMA